MAVQAIRISYFTNETEEQFRRSRRKNILHNHNNVNCREGDNVLLVNMETRVVFGAGELEGICEERNLLEDEVYSEFKYNKYEIPAKSVFLFPKPLKYTDLFEMIGIAPGTWNSISNGQFGAFKPFMIQKNITPEAKAEIVRRLTSLVKTYV